MGIELTAYHAKYFAHELSLRHASNIVEKLDGWAEDLKPALEREIKEMDRQIKETGQAHWCPVV